MGTQRGAALGGRCWKQKARCWPAGWIDCGPMASVLEKLRNRPPGRKQLTGGPSATRWRAHGRLGQTGGAQEHQLAAARPVHFCCRWSVRLFQPVSLPLPLPLLYHWLLCSCRASVEHLSLQLSLARFGESSPRGPVLFLPALSNATNTLVAPPSRRRLDPIGVDPFGSDSFVGSPLSEQPDPSFCAWIGTSGPRATESLTGTDCSLFSTCLSAVLDTKPSARRQAFERSAHCQFRLQVCITRPWLPVETSCFCALPTPYHDTTSLSAAAALGPTLPLHDSPNHDRSLLNRPSCLRPVVIRPLSPASVADSRLPSSTLLPSLASPRPCATRKLRRRSGTPTPLSERTSSSPCASEPRARHQYRPRCPLLSHRSHLPSSFVVKHLAC